jgi:hypothetical protein
MDGRSRWPRHGKTWLQITETPAIDAVLLIRTKGWGMIDLTEEERRVALSVWAGLVSFAALLYLTGSFWKAAVIGAFVLVSCVLGLGQRWLLRGSFAIAIVAIAIALGAPSPDQWAQLLQDARRTLLPG